MQFTITQGQLGTRPPVVKPDPKVLEFLGEEGMRKLISDHYDLLRESNIKGLFHQVMKVLLLQNNIQLISLYKFVEDIHILMKIEEHQ